MRKTIPQGLPRRNAAGEEAARLSAAARFFLSSEALLPKELFVEAFLRSDGDFVLVLTKRV